MCHTLTKCVPTQVRAGMPGSKRAAHKVATISRLERWAGARVVLCLVDFAEVTELCPRQ